jgi:hypothetical protein
MNKIEALITAILSIPGDKIVTIATAEYHQAYDIKANGDIGYAPTHKQLFEAHLVEAFRSGGGISIRQFLNIKVERVMPSGKKIWIPRKNIYGISVVNGEWFGISKADLVWAHCTDAATGKPLPAEPDVTYQDFSHAALSG